MKVLDALNMGEPKTWREENYPIGKRFGYPDCCIEEFCQLTPEEMREKKPNKEDVMRFEAAHLGGRWTGFIPCKKHAKQIMDGETRLADLINYKERDSSFGAFPFHDKISIQGR